MARHDDDSIPTGPEVLKTQGEPTAHAYVEASVPASSLCPTVEMDKVRVLPPSQTPTAKLDDLQKHAGPRNPDQLEPAPPKPPVELPEHRPTTARQVIAIDPDVLLDLAHRTIDSDEPTPDATSHVPPAARSDSSWVHEDARSAGRRGHAKHAVLLGAALLALSLTLGLVATSRNTPRREEPAGAASSSSTAPSATTTTAPSATPSATPTPAPTTSTTAPLATTGSTAAARIPSHPRPDPTPYDDPPAPPSSSHHPAAPVPTASPRAGTLPEF